MGRFVMMIGLPASGKTYYAEHSYSDYLIFSSDLIRKELYGDESIQGDNHEVFRILHERIKTNLKNGCNVVYDATNISYKKRMAFLREIKSINCLKTARLIWTPLSKCLENNKNRERHVPEEVIYSMYKHFEFPCLFEGWDNILIGGNISDNIKNPFDLVESLEEFNQDNKYHSLTLGNHLKTCYNMVQNCTIDVQYAALLHDIGKPMVKSFKNYKGQPSEFAHYYRHENVSAYESVPYVKWLSIKYEGIRIVPVCGLIQWHMLLHNQLSDKSLIKYKRIFGEEFFSKLEELYEADKAAHYEEL